MTSSENPYAGQGPVLLDIGGTVGALVVTMPGSTDGLEVELRPVGGEQAHTHVGVVARPTGTGTVHSLVYPGVEEGDYSLHPLPDGPAVATVTVRGGEVTSVPWPQ